MDTAGGWLTIRPADAADAEVIGEISVLAWRAAYEGLMPAAYLDALDPNERAARWVDGLRSLIDDAVRNGSDRPNTRGRPGTIFEHNFGGTIGTNIEGNATSRLRVVVDPDGNVITAFPF